MIPSTSPSEESLKSELFEALVVTVKALSAYLTPTTVIGHLRRYQIALVEQIRISTRLDDFSREFMSG